MPPTTDANVTRSSTSAREKDDCAVKAVAIATGRNYEFVRGMFFALGRKEHTPTPTSVTKDVIRTLGYELVDIPMAGGTTRTLISKLDDKGIFLAWVNAHIFCVRYGQCKDWVITRGLRVKSVSRLELRRCKQCGSREARNYYFPPPDWQLIPNTIRQLFFHSYSGKLSLEKQGVLCIPCLCKVWICSPNQAAYLLAY